MINQLNLFDPEKYSTPSHDGKPDWYYDTHDGDEFSPSASEKKDDSPLEQIDSQVMEPAKPLPAIVSLPLTQINPPEKITGGGNSTPGEEVVPSAIASPCSGGGNLEQTREGDRSIGGDRTGAENLEDIPEGDRSIGGDRPGAEQNSENLAMLGNASGDRPCSLASDSTPLTVEEGKAIWDDLIFGRKAETLGRVAETTPESSGDRYPGRGKRIGMQSSNHTPDVAFIESAMNAIYRDEKNLSDQRRHNGKPGASGWLGMQFKYRDSEGKSKTCTKWKAGCTGPYYQYQWRDGDRIRSRYVPRQKLEQVELALMTRESTRAILEILG